MFVFFRGRTKVKNYYTGNGQHILLTLFLFSNCNLLCVCDHAFSALTLLIGHLRMTYTVSSGTLNPSIPYHTIPYHTTVDWATARACGL